MLLINYANGSRMPWNGTFGLCAEKAAAFRC